MSPKPKKPGSKKGQPKPKRWVVDDGFGDRIKEVLPEGEIQDCARRTGITASALHRYRSGDTRIIEALPLFKLADDRKCSARWLATGKPGKNGLLPEEFEILDAYRKSTEEERQIFRMLGARFSGEQKQ